MFFNEEILAALHPVCYLELRLIMECTLAADFDQFFRV